MDWIIGFICRFLPFMFIASFFAAIYLVVSFLYEEYTGKKKEKLPENRTEQPRERRQINCENCKAKDWCTLKYEPKAVKVKVKRRKYKTIHFPYEVNGYNANCKYCVFNRACSVKGVKKYNSCGRYRERK